MEMNSYGGIERLLQIIFTRYANKEYHEGFFIVNAEFGADWFTPILQQPYVILRHLPNTHHDYYSLSNHHIFRSYVMFYLGPNIKEFIQTLKSVGLIPGQNSWYISLTLGLALI